MPYIKEYERKKYEKAVKDLGVFLRQLSNEKLSGELNFVLTSIVKAAIGPSQTEGPEG